MVVARFEDLQDEFLARVGAAVYCTMATVDRQNRPRLRLMHPIWEGPVGWVISWPASPKFKHLAQNASVALAYAADTARPVYIDGVAEVINNAEEKQRVWDVYRTTPPPIGFDPEPHYGSIHNDYYGLLRITPSRITLANLGGEAIIWQAG